MLIDDTWSNVIKFFLFFILSSLLVLQMTENNTKFIWMLMLCNFIANDPSKKHTKNVDYIFSVLLPNDIGKWNVMKSNSISLQCNLTSLKSPKKKATQEAGEEVHKKSYNNTKTNEEGQMKSSVTNDVLPIPRGDLLQWLCRMIFWDFFSLHNRCRKKKNNTSSDRPHIPANHGSQISLWGLPLCALFSHEFKSEKPQKSQFQYHCWNRNKLKPILSLSPQNWIPFRQLTEKEERKVLSCNWFRSISLI